LKEALNLIFSLHLTILRLYIINRNQQNLLRIREVSETLILMFSSHFKNIFIGLMSNINMKKEQKEIENKKAVSPVISTVLLIMIVVVLAAIILVWSRGFIKEAITKDVGGQTKSVDQLCSSEVSLKTFVNDKDGSFGFTNNGNFPLYGFSLKLTSKTSGGSNVIDFSTTSVNTGKSFTVPPPYKYGDYSEVKIIPVLLGKASSGTQKYECPEINGVVV
jgi:flagellin-like protein